MRRYRGKARQRGWGGRAAQRRPPVPCAWSSCPRRTRSRTLRWTVWCESAPAAPLAPNAGTHAPGACAVQVSKSPLRHDLSPMSQTESNVTHMASELWMSDEGMLVLPLEAAVTNGSPFVHTSGDPRQYLAPQDRVRFAMEGQVHPPFGNETSPQASTAFPVYEVVGVASNSISLAEPYSGVTATRMQAWKVTLSADDYITETHRRARERLRRRWVALEGDHEREEEAAKRRHEQRRKRIQETEQKKKAEERRKEEARKEEERRKRRKEMACKKEEEQKRKKEEEEKRKKRSKEEREKLAKREFAALENAFKPKPMALQHKAPNECLKNHPRWYCLLKSSGMANYTKPFEDVAPLSDVCDDGEQLPGTVDVLSSSPIVYTSDNLMGEVNVGETVMISGQRFTVSEPRDSRTLTLSSRYVGKSQTKLPICKMPDPSHDIGVVPLPGCVSVLHGSAIVRTSQDLSDAILNGETMRVLNRLDTVMSPRDERTVTLAHPWKGETKVCVKAYKVSPTWAAGQVPFPCHISVRRDDDVVDTACDLRDFLNVDDIVKIGTRTYAIRGPFTAKNFRIMSPYKGASASGLQAYKQARRVRLSGFLTVTRDQPVVTSTVDLRSELSPGDSVEIARQQYRVVAPVDATEFTLAEPYKERSAAHLVGYRIAGTDDLVSGCLDVTKDSTKAMTTADIRSEVSPGDKLRLNGREYTLTEPMGGEFVTLDTPYLGESQLCVNGYKVGKSAQQLTLEALAREKLKCTSILCLAKIEQQERGLPFQTPRTLAGGAMAAKIASSINPAAAPSQTADQSGAGGAAAGGGGAGDANGGSGGGGGGGGGDGGNGGGGDEGNGGGGDGGNGGGGGSPKVGLTPMFKSWMNDVVKAKGLKSVDKYVANAKEEMDKTKGA